MWSIYVYVSLYFFRIRQAETIWIIGLHTLGKEGNNSLQSCKVQGGLQVIVYFNMYIQLSIMHTRFSIFYQEWEKHWHLFLHFTWVTWNVPKQLSNGLFFLSMIGVDVLVLCAIWKMLFSVTCYLSSKSGILAFVIGILLLLVFFCRVVAQIRGVAPLWTLNPKDLNIKTSNHRDGWCN